MAATLPLPIQHHDYALNKHRKLTLALLELHMLGQHSQYSDYATGWMEWDSFPDRDIQVLFLQNVQIAL